MGMGKKGKRGEEENGGSFIGERGYAENEKGQKAVDKLQRQRK